MGRGLGLAESHRFGFHPLGSTRHYQIPGLLRFGLMECRNSDSVELLLGAKISTLLSMGLLLSDIIPYAGGKSNDYTDQAFAGPQTTQ